MLFNISNIYPITKPIQCQETFWPLQYLKFHMELFQVLQNTDFDYDPYKKQHFVQAWKSYGNEQTEYIPIVQSALVKPQNKSPEQSIMRNKIKFLQHKVQNYLVANTYGKLAYCSYNSKKVEIVIIQEDDNEQKQFNLDEYTGLYANQGITGISFATPSILTLVSLNYLYIVPIHKKIQQIKELDLFSGHTRVLQRQQRFSIKSNLNLFSYFSIFNRVFNMIKSNQRLCLVTSDQSTIIYVIDIFTNELINQLNFSSKIVCFDLNNNDQVLVGLSNQCLHYRDLRSGEQNNYYFKQNVVCVAFQNFSFVQTLEQTQQNQFFNKNPMAHSRLSGSSTFQSSILDKLFQDQNNILKQSGMVQECQNLAVFALNNDVVLFQLNVKQQKIVKTFDFSVQVQSDSNFEVGGKILDVKWKDCCLVIKFKNNVLVSMLHNTSLVMIGGLIQTEESSEIDAGQFVTLCNAGQLESYIV